MPYANEPTVILAPPAGAPASGSLLLGKYRLHSLIGSGGTADVWSARDESRERMVTIKLLRDRDDPAVRQRFLDEGLWLEAIEHPGIVRALGRHDTLGLTLIVFEYLEGTTLAHELARAPIAPREAASFIRQLGSALGALHAHGVLHLDLKPANIMVAPDRRVRLIDLGIADLIGNTREVILGTPGYAAPEVQAGRAPTRATDVYGLALVARDVLGDLSRDPRVAAVLRFGLFTDPARRPSSATRFALALSAVVLFHELVAWMAARKWIVRTGTPTLSFGSLSSTIRTYARALAYAGVAIVLVSLALALPRFGADVAAVETGATSATAPVRPYALPPIAAYSARFEYQTPYPTVTAGSPVEWVVGLRNIGTAGWFADRDGARAALALADGTIVGTQSAPYVGPGEVAMFVVRFTAPATPGMHTVRVHLVIEGTGALPDLGIFANVSVLPRHVEIGGRH
ncbi:MAG TPA: protein kinase [Candidatus Limnocylindrales bacterium]|nr:protein kinase [Candidatus Limnocylindrales bacterium]